MPSVAGRVLLRVLLLMIIVAGGALAYAALVTYAH